MKSPPVQHPDDRARDEVERFIREHARTVAPSGEAPAST
jgi:hypothetical protein